MTSGEPTTRRPPAGVVLVARAHCLVSAVILSCVGLLYVTLRGMGIFAIAPETYLYTVGLGLMYAAAGMLVWTGAPFGRFLSYVCSLIYLTRPQLGDPVWRTMRSAEYKAHFDRRPGKTIPR